MVALFIMRDSNASNTKKANNMIMTGLKFAISTVSAVLQLGVLILDNIIWIGIILTFAGPMMLSGLYEAVLDWKILSAISSEAGRRLSEGAIVELLATVVSGNLLHHSNNTNSTNSPSEVDPQTEITSMLVSSPKPEPKAAGLLGLVNSQMGYGAVIGGPVLFYLGAFVYTILDLSSNPSDEDAASLAFGVEWMIIVHVAIIGSCVLATNNPSTVSALVGRLSSQSPRHITRSPTTQNLAGHPQSGFWRRLLHGKLGKLGFLDDIYDSRYQPVTMWSRGRNKKNWVQNSEAWRATLHGNQNTHLSVGWWAKIFLVLLPTYLLINLPPMAGAVVAWRTPLIGWGCRSLSFVCYAGAQFFVTNLFITMHYLPSPQELMRPQRTMKFWNNLLAWLRYLTELLFCVFVYVLFVLSCVGSLFVVLGSTLMQVIGVYRNCFCYVNAPRWYSLNSASVQVATDTQEQRNSSHNWIVFGGVATAFMGICCCGGWWYQKVIRERYKKIVRELFSDQLLITQTRASP